jgi:hypothetical protein
MRIASCMRENGVVLRFQKAAYTERKSSHSLFANDRIGVGGWVTNEYHNMPLVRGFDMSQAHQ